jgi:Flp pilus assembly protein TadD
LLIIDYQAKRPSGAGLSMECQERLIHKGRRGLSIYWLLPLLIGAVGLAGCEPFPMHLDPLSVNGRDGGGSPPSYDALMRIGAAARAGGDYANAVSVFRRAAEIATSQPAPFIAIGDTLLQAGNVNEAILAYNSALARDGSNPEALLGLAKAYIATGRPQLALGPVSQALAEHPDAPRLWLVLGVLKDLEGQHQEAQDCYRNGLNFAPGDKALTVDLALSLALSGNFPAAVATLQPVAMAPSSTASERQNLALIYGLQGNLAEAARLGRIDLDAASVQHNLAYYQTLRQLPPEARTRAVFSAGTVNVS